MERQKVNIMIGRFQPMTNGHLKCVEYAYQKLKIPTIIAMIDTPDDKVDSKHPFPSSMLLPIYKDIFDRSRMVKDIILVKNANIVTIGSVIYDMGYQVASWTCGTDRIDSYSKMAEKYKETAHLSDDFQMLEIKRSDEDISATKVRQAIMDDDFDTFSKMTPFVSLKARIKMGNSLFNILKAQLKKVLNK